MEQTIRFCTTADGVRIAYATVGQGSPLVWSYSWVTHLELDWSHPASKQFLEPLARNHLLVRFDKRGTGLSDREPQDTSREARLLDLTAVVDAVGLDSFALVGESEAGPIAITYAVQNPSRVSHLILYGSHHRWSPPTQVIQPLIGLIRNQWGMGSAALSSIFVPSGDPSQASYFSELQRIGASGEIAARILESNIGTDVSNLLPRIQAPTLVIHRRDDRAAPFAVAREMAHLIPGARLESLAGDIHPPYWGDSASVLNAISRFLGDPPPDLTSAGQPDAAQLRTVLFTDLVGHTEMMSRLGDEAGRAVLREHERITREVLAAHGGAEIKTMGDGFMASFGSVTKAVECAVALQRAIDERNRAVGAQSPAPLHSHGEPTPAESIHVRIGLNAGEPIEEDGDLFGATVILASRIAAKADGGEILVSDTVRGLCSGKGFLFADRGEFLAKGFEEPVRVYEVRWRE